MGAIRRESSSRRRASLGGTAGTPEGCDVDHGPAGWPVGPTTASDPWPEATPWDGDSTDDPFPFRRSIAVAGHHPSGAGSTSFAITPRPWLTHQESRLAHGNHVLPMQSLLALFKTCMGEQ